MKVAQNQKRTILLAPAVAATATRSAALLDTLGADYATIEVAIGTRIAATQSSNVTIAITEGDVATGDFATFNADFSKAIAIGTNPQVAAFHIHLDGTRKRFFKVLSTPGTAATGDAIAVAVIGVLDSEISPLGTVGQADVVVIG
jgi:hypothetical protein